MVRHSAASVMNQASSYAPKSIHAMKQLLIGVGSIHGRRGVYRRGTYGFNIFKLDSHLHSCEMGSRVFWWPTRGGLCSSALLLFKRDRSFVIVDCHVLDHALAVCVTCLTHEVDCCLLHTLHAVWAAPV